MSPNGSSGVTEVSESPEITVFYTLDVQSSSCTLFRQGYLSLLVSSFFSRSAERCSTSLAVKLQKCLQLTFHQKRRELEPHVCVELFL